MHMFVFDFNYNIILRIFNFSSRPFGLFQRRHLFRNEHQIWRNVVTFDVDIRIIAILCWFSLSWGRYKVIIACIRFLLSLQSEWSLGIGHIHLLICSSSRSLPCMGCQLHWVFSQCFIILRQITHLCVPHGELLFGFRKNSMFCFFSNSMSCRLQSPLNATNVWSVGRICCRHLEVFWRTLSRVLLLKSGLNINCYINKFSHDWPLKYL